MAIAFVNLGSTATPDMNTNTEASSFTNSTSVPPTGLVCIFLHSDRNSGDVSDPTITGTNGWNVTFTKIVGLNGAGTSQGQYLYAAETAGGSTGTITVNYGGNNQAGFATSLFYVTGADTSGGVAAAFVQTKTATASSTATPSITLDSAASNSANRSIAYFYNNAGVACTPRASWTEMDDWGGNARAPQTQVREDTFEQTGSATPASGTPNWFMLMAEVKAASTSSVKTANGLARASVKTFNGLALASVKTVNGLA